MADYPQLAPSVAALDAVKTIPTDAEASAKWPAVDRQTRVWLVDFLSTIVDPDTGKVSSGAFNDDTIPEGAVRGSTANDGEQREVLQGSISTVDLRDDAVTTPKILNEAVTREKLPDDVIGSDEIDDAVVLEQHIGNEEVTTPKLGNESVTSAKIAPQAVTTAKIAPGAVTTAEIATNGIDGSNLPIGTSGQVLLHNGTKFVPTTLSGSVAVSGTGVVTVSLTSSSAAWVRISERVASGTNAGAASAASWAQKRGVLTAWVIEEQTVAGIVGLGASGKINIQTNGMFLITVTWPAYSVGSHKGRVTFTPVSGPAVDYYSSTEVAGPGMQTSARLQALISVTGASSGTPATLDIFHWTELAKATNGLGLAASSGDVEKYSMVEMLQVSAA